MKILIYLCLATITPFVGLGLVNLVTGVFHVYNVFLAALLSTGLVIATVRFYQVPPPSLERQLPLRRTAFVCLVFCVLFFALALDIGTQSAIYHAFTFAAMLFTTIVYAILAFKYLPVSQSANRSAEANQASISTAVSHRISRKEKRTGWLVPLAVIVVIGNFVVYRELFLFDAEIAHLRAETARPENNGDPSIESLVKQLNYYKTRDKAIDALVEIGEPAVPVLIEALGESDVSASRWARETLIRIGEPAVPYLVKSLTSDSSNIWFELPRLGSLAIPTLIEALRHENVEIRRKAARELSLLVRRGQDDMDEAERQKAISALIESLADEKEGFRTTIRNSLRLAGKSTIPPVIEALNHPNMRVRLEAIKVLTFLDMTRGGVVRHAQPAQVIPVLIEATRSENPEIRREAITMFHQEALISSDSALEAVPALIERLEDESEGAAIRVSAANALVVIDPTLRERVISVLVQIVEKKNPPGFALAASYLGSIDITRRDFAVAALIEASRDERVEARRQAASALVEFPDFAGEIVPCLKERLSDKDPDVRFFTATSLIRLDPTADNLTRPVIVEALKVKNGKIDHTKILALKQVKPEIAVPAWTEILKTEESFTREIAAKALKDIGTPEAQKALEDLKVRDPQFYRYLFEKH